MAKRVAYHGNNMDRIMFKTVKFTKKAVLGVHTGVLAGIGAGYKLHEDVSDIAKIMNSKKGRLALKKIAAVGTAIFTVAGMVASISEISKNIPEVSAAEVPTVNNSIVEEAGDLDIDKKYGDYDINGNVSYSNDNVAIDSSVIVLHNADGSSYSQEILTETGQKLYENGIQYVYANSDDELLEDLQNINVSGRNASVISIESGKNNNNQTLVSSSYVAGKLDSDPKTSSELLAGSIVSQNPTALYEENGVASDIVSGERRAGAAQEAIVGANVEKNKKGEPLYHVETLLTIRPSGLDIPNPKQLASEIVLGIGEYNKIKENLVYSHKL